MPYKRTLLALLCAAALVALAPDALAQDGAAAAPVVNVENANKPTFFQVVWSARDAITYIIFALSLLASTYIILGFLRARASVLVPEPTVARIRDLIGQKQFQELLDYTERDPSFVGGVLAPALRRAPSFSSMKEALETSIAERTADEFRRIEILNIVGNLGPLLGLLGTVVGMIDAFAAMQGTGGANPSTLSAGIAKALAHTFMGLALAVPALAAYGILRGMMDRLTTRGAVVAEDLLLLIKPESSSSGTRAAPATSSVARAAQPPRPTVQPTTSSAVAG